jgi:hypothetical protein
LVSFISSLLLRKSIGFTPPPRRRLNLDPDRRRDRRRRIRGVRHAHHDAQRAAIDPEDEVDARPGASRSRAVTASVIRLSPVGITCTAGLTVATPGLL